MCLCAVFGAVLQGSLFGLVGLFPPRYSTLFMSGQGLAGIFAGLAMLFSLLSEYAPLFSLVVILLKRSTHDELSASALVMYSYGVEC